MSLKLAAALLALSGAAYASPAGAWTLLGVREVNDRTERDTIVLPGPRDFHQIKFCVARNPVEFHDVDVYFGNGGHQDIAVRERVPAGACTRDIDLTGADRNITRIEFRYEETSARRARATVRVFGRG
ncbi:MAG: DUF2541 family protein [Parvularculaceae bacterium]|nr:DUF2541 family protein [Parvularculaceae bacterium]